VEHCIESIPFNGLPDRVILRPNSAIASGPRLRIAMEKDVYIHAEATSLIFRFVDDVKFFVDWASKRIHFRLASRVGHSDLGVNRSRRERLRRAF
jgi:uncharacterized protein (DUF1499 family)